MPSARETALLALFNALKTLTGPVVLRNENDPERIPPGGLINIEDGEPGEPEVTLSPLIYHYEHKALIVCVVQQAKSEDRDAQLDGILQSIGEKLQQDTTLGGAVEYLEIQAPVTEGLSIEGAIGVKEADLPVILYFDAESPV